MFQELQTHLIDEAVQLIRAAKHVIAFTGAGISTDSGIPDFRSPDCGLWERVDPFEVASIYGFRKNPRAFYDWVRSLANTTLTAIPNPAHYALSTLESGHNLRGVITQNIDGLHTRAGTSTLYELHGHMRTATCIQCFKTTEAEPRIKQFLEDNQLPTCVSCGGVLKPDVILFGEQLPYEQLQGAQDASRKCDLMIIIGSSLEVAPASDLPVLAKRTGAKIVIVNLEPTPMDYLADVVLHGRAAVVLPEIVSRLEKST